MDQFVIDMKEALEKRNVDDFIAFMEKYVDDGYYSKEMIERYKKSSDAVKLGALCKCICNVEEVSYPTRFWAKEQLKKLGMRESIF